MGAKLIKITNFISHRTALSLLIFTIFCRLPFFFRDIYDWDESTFLLVGQSLLDGHLPFTKLWDLKPALLGYIYGFIIFFSGKSIFLIRLYGSLFVFGTSMAVYFLGKTIANKSVGIFASLLFISYASLFPGGQGFLSEHAAIPFLMYGSLLYIRNQNSPFFSGLLLSLAAMIRLNLAFVGAGLLIGILFSFLRSRDLNRLVYVLKYCLGGFVGLFLIALPYLLIGKVDLWFRSTFLAPFSYSNYQMSVIKVFLKQLENIWWATFPKGDLSLVILGVFIWMGTFGYLLNKKSAKEKKVLYIFVLVFFSIIKSGAAFSHYLIQLFPFLCIFSILFFAKIFEKFRFETRNLILLPVFAASFSLGNQYFRNIWETLDPPRWTFGFSTRLVDSLENYYHTDDQFFFMCDHLTYWWFEKEPMRPSITHPSNITRDYLFEFMEKAEKSSFEEFQVLLKKKPTWIIKKPNEKYLSKIPGGQEYLQNVLRREYSLFRKMEGREIWHLNK
ncbi:MAG: hypothetical protein CNE98_02245 [Bacteroidetes bacterium MED-G17]|nr:MAG: hypothetical protein CNE98_02245 [Bacteroidetes bacterium MED-G17]